jgi:hypothetical protein
MNAFARFNIEGLPFSLTFDSCIRIPSQLPQHRHRRAYQQFSENLKINQNIIVNPYIKIIFYCIHYKLSTAIGAAALSFA